MALNESQRKIWAAQLLSSLKKNLVFAGPRVVNRNYEGEIRDQGDTVKIISVGRPTIGDYVKGVTVINPEQLTDAERSLTITEAKYFAFEIDDIDRAQTGNGGALMNEAATESAYALRDIADGFVAGLYSGADAANQIGTTSITTSALAVDAVNDLKVRLDEKDVPSEGRYCIVPAWFHGLLSKSEIFTDLSASGSTEALRNGQVGRLFGFDILMSNNVPIVTGDDYRVSAGYTGALTYADQIVKTESYRPENSFSDAMKGLHVYGAKLVRPEAVATLIASRT